MSWYQPFMLTVAGVWVLSSPRDRIAARIILIATLGSFLMVSLVTRHIEAPWKLIFPGAVETLTIGALLTWTPNRTGYLQCCCLVVAWFAHLFCYLDIVWRTNFVYDRYGQILGVVAFAQILSFHDTITLNLRRLGRWCSPRRRSVGGFRPASVSPIVLHRKGDTHL